MFIFLIVGCLFFSIGLMMVLGFLRFRREGEKIHGTVRAIEKYISVSNGENGRSETTMFRPIVDYLYKGEARIVTGIGSSSISYKPKQSITVFVIADHETGAIHARMDDKSYIVMGVFFALMGLIAVVVYAMGNNGSWDTAKIGLGIAAVAGVFLPKLARPSIKSGEDNQVIKEDAVLIQTEAEYIVEVTRHKIGSYVITSITLLAGCGLLYWAYSFLSGPSFSHQEVQAAFSSFDGFYERLITDRLAEKWKKSFALLGMGSLLTLISIHSLIYQWNKYKDL